MNLLALIFAILTAFAGGGSLSVDNPNDLDPAVCVTGYEAECLWMGDTVTNETVVTYAEANNFGFYVELSDGTVIDVPVCDTEDQADCIWIAGLQGNGVGRSFVDVAGIAYYFGQA